VLDKSPTRHVIPGIRHTSYVVVISRQLQLLLPSALSLSWTLRVKPVLMSQQRSLTPLPCRDNISHPCFAYDSWSIFLQLSQQLLRATRQRNNIVLWQVWSMIGNAIPTHITDSPWNLRGSHYTCSRQTYSVRYSSARSTLPDRSWP